MAERKCGNCKHFSSCSGVNADDVPENMMCNDFEAAPAAGGKDIGENAAAAETKTTPPAETKTTPPAETASTTTRRKSVPTPESNNEVPPPSDEDDGLPPADDDPGLPPAGDDDPGMPPAEESATPPAEEVDNDWDVFGSKVMTRYVGPKAARLVAEAAKAGINVDGMKPADMHEALLRWKAEQDAQADAAGQPFDDQLPTEEDESKPDPRAVAPSQDKIEAEIEAKRKAYEAQCAAITPTKSYVDCSPASATFNPLARHALIGMKAELENQIAVLQRQVIALDLVIESM